MSVSPPGPKLGGNVELCSVCNDKVYPLDRFVIEKLVMHKGCFKCKHCDRKLSLSNFAAVNNTVYCKVHYLKLFRESGGKYDKAFGDGGFQKKTAGAYVPGQFKGVSALPSHVAKATSAPQMSPVIAQKVKKPPEVSKLSAEDEDEELVDEISGDFDEPKPSVKDILKVYEASLRDASSVGSDADSPAASPVQRVGRSPPGSGDKSPTLQGNAENRLKWLTGVSSQHIKTHAEVDDAPGGSFADRKAAYLAQVSGGASLPLAANDFSVTGKDASPSAAVASATEVVAGNLANRLKWSENLGQTHIHTHSEIDRTSLGTAAERKQAYLDKVSGVGSPSASTAASPSEDKKVAKTISEKIRAFSTQSPPSSSSSAKREEVSPGKIEDRIQKFMEAAAGSSSPSSSVGHPHEVGKIDDKLKAFEEVAKASSHALDKAEREVLSLTENLSHVVLGNEEGAGPSRDRTDALVAPSPLKPEAGQAGAHIRSFNEGANATLRRTPSWLRQQRALEEANAAPADVSAPSSSLEAPVEVEETKTQEPGEAVVSGDDAAGEGASAPSTPVKADGDSPSEDGGTPPAGSIMKRGGSFKKEKTPGEKRVVRFGHAEIHELPSSPKTPDPSDVVRSSTSGHSASKGSALAAYLKVMDNQARKRTQGEALEAPSSSSDHHHEAPPSPPPPILSPGARSPGASQSLLASEVAKESVDLGAPASSSAEVATEVEPEQEHMDNKEEDHMEVDEEEDMVKVDGAE